MKTADIIGIAIIGLIIGAIFSLITFTLQEIERDNNLINNLQEDNLIYKKLLNERNQQLCILQGALNLCKLDLNAEKNNITYEYINVTNSSLIVGIGYNHNLFEKPNLTFTANLVDNDTGFKEENK